MFKDMQKTYFIRELGDFPELPKNTIFCLIQAFFVWFVSLNNNMDILIEMLLFNLLLALKIFLKE